MKIQYGGTMGFKIQGKQYESVDASAVFTLEKEFPDGVKIEDKELEVLSDKVNDTLKKEAVKHMKTALNEYWATIKNISKLSR